MDSFTTRLNVAHRKWTYATETLNSSQKVQKQIKNLFQAMKIETFNAKNHIWRTQNTYFFVQHNVLFSFKNSTFLKEPYYIKAF